jgi:tetratricopeptide (TPR) repeat protein
MGLEQIYHFRLALDKRSRGLFPETRGKAGPAFDKAVEGRIRATLEPLAGIIQALLVSKREIRLTWQAGEAQAESPVKSAVRLARGNAAQGVLLLELFLSGQPDNPELLYALGMAYCEQNALERAIELLARLVELAPGYVNGRVAIGAALLQAGRITEGVSELEKAVRQDPENLWAHHSLGAGLMLLNRYSEAAANLRLAREIDPQDQPAWFDYGQALEAMGEPEQAEMAYGKTIEIDEFSGVAEQARQRKERLEGKKI